MKDCVIYGAGQFGEYVYRQLVKGDQFRVVGFIDNFITERVKLSLPIWNEASFLTSVYHECSVVMGIADPYIAIERIVSLLSNNVNEIYLYDSYNPYLLNAWNALGFTKALASKKLIRYKDIKPSLPYLESHIVDHCNLRCRGCEHFSNIMPSNNYPSVAKFEASLRKLAERFYSIKIIRLLGGEPLLNPDLPQFVYIVRRYFPLSDVRIVTNGLLIPQITEELANSMRSCCVKFDISQYEPTSKMIDKILYVLSKNRIGFNISRLVKNFTSKGSMGGEDFNHVFQGCFRTECTFLRNNKIYVCAKIPMLYENRDYFGFDIGAKEFELNGIDFFDEDLDGWEILLRLKKPFSMCKYCSPNEKVIPWAVGKNEIADWIV